MKILRHAACLMLALCVVGGCARVIGLGDGYYLDELSAAGASQNDAGENNLGGSDAGGANSGGSAGSSGADSTWCEQYPLSKRASWLATASSQFTDNPPSNLLDNSEARWSTGKPQSGDEWLQIDFGSAVAVRSVNLQQGSYGNDYPRQYTACVSDVSQSLNCTVAASGQGTSGVTTTIVLPKPRVGRYLLIKQLGSSLSWWSVEELEVGCVD